MVQNLFPSVFPLDLVRNLCPLILLYIGLVIGGLQGFCEKLPETFSLSSRGNPSWANTDMLLAKAGPVRNGGNTSVIRYLRRKRKTLLRKKKKHYCTDIIVAWLEQIENM